MPDTRTRNVDDEFLVELLRRSQPPPKAPSTPTPIEPACPKDKTYSERELGLQNEGSKRHRNSTWSEPFTQSLKRASTQSERTGIPRPCTPPNKIIPPYGLFPRHTRPSAPPTPKHTRPSTPPTPRQVPSLCGSSIPSANTTPEKLFLTSPQVDFSGSPVLSSRAYVSLKKPKRSRRPLTGHGDAKSEVAQLSLLTWLDGTADETSPEHSDDEDVLLDKDQDAIPPTSPQSDEGSPGGSVSDNETWGESSSSEDEGAVLLPQFQQFLQSAVKNLYTHFQEWKKNTGHQTRGEWQDSHQSGTKSSFTNTTASSTQPKGGKSNKSPGKRRSSDEDEDRASKLPRLDPSREDQDTRLLACPFAKKNPLQHRKCFKYVLQEIARLKQHLLRVHQVPIHCARCSKVFETIEERDHHSRQPECIVQPPHIFDGINESQRRQLGKRISSKKSREENWYLIYQILFPDAARPESPYIEDICLSEELLAMREFAIQAAPARIAAFANTHLPPSLHSNQQQIELFTQAAVRDVFDMILESWDSSCQSGQSSIENTPHRSTSGRSSSGHDSGYSTTGPPSGSSGYSSGGASGFGVFNDNPVPRPEFGPLPSAQGLDLVTAGLEGSGEWDYENVFGNFGDGNEGFLV